MEIKYLYNAGVIIVEIIRSIYKIHRKKLRKNKILANKDSLVWKAGMADWVKLTSVDELNSLFQSVPPVPTID